MSKVFFNSFVLVLGGIIMAKIIDNLNGRRSILLSTDDIIDIVREYQAASKECVNYDEIRKKIDNRYFYLPEDII